MNHVPKPRDCVALDLDIPYLSTLTIPCGQNEFENFPGAHGFETGPDGVLTFHELQKKSPNEALDFVQTWLFFGVMARVFLDNFQAAHFRQLYNRDMIDSRPVLSLIQSLSSTLKRGQPRDVRWIWDIRKFAHKQCDELDQDWANAGPLWPRLLLSIHILLETLECIPRIVKFTKTTRFGHKARSHTVRETYYDSLRSDKLDSRQTSVRAIFEQDVISKTWCRKQFHRICHIDSYAAIVYLCRLKRAPRRSGWPAMCDQDPSRCSCYDFTREALVGAHTTEGCSCRPPAVDVGTMTSILRSGGIPLLKCVSRRRGCHRDIVSLSYERASPTRRFVALSHVWADGLCHPESSTILSCQLHAIVDSISEVQGRSKLRKSQRIIDEDYKPTEQTVYLWIDFMCVPQQPEEVSRPSEYDTLSIGATVQLADAITEKAVALSLMPAVYSWASFVLVVDSEVASTSTPHYDMELEARIGVSGWNARYWTFQEQCLARALYFKQNPFRHRYTSEPELSATEKMWRSSIQEKIKLLSEREVVISRATTLDNKSCPKGRQFSRVWNALVDRSTTRSEDAMLIFATLLDLDPFEISSLSLLAQVKALISTQESISCSVLTANMERNHRLALAEERWLPTMRGSLPVLSSDHLRDVCPDGLLLRKSTMFCAFLLERVKVHEGAIYLVATKGPSGDKIHIRMKQQTDGCTELLALKNDTVIFCLDFSQSSHNAEQQENGGAILTVESQHDSRYNTLYHCPVFWWNCDPRNSNFVEDRRWCEATEVHLPSSNNLIMIRCDIASWGVLNKRRDIIIEDMTTKLRQCQGGIYSIIYIILLLMISPIPGMFCFTRLAVALGLEWGMGFALYTGTAGLILSILCIHAAIRFFVKRAAEYFTMHSMLPSADNRKELPTWRHLNEALPQIKSWRDLRNCEDLGVVLVLRLFTLTLWVGWHAVQGLLMICKCAWTTLLLVWSWQKKRILLSSGGSSHTVR